MLSQGLLKALLQDRKAAEKPKEAKAAAFPFPARAWARLKALIMLVMLLYTIPGPAKPHSHAASEVRSHPANSTSGQPNMPRRLEHPIYCSYFGACGCKCGLGHGALDAAGKLEAHPEEAPSFAGVAYGTRQGNRHSER